MKMTKPLTVLSLLAAFVVVSVASSPVTYPGSAESEAVNALPRSLSLCDTDLCAGHAFVTLNHSRGIDAELTIKAQGSWNFLNDTFAEPDLVMIECESDCIAERDAYLTDTLAPCAFEEAGCSAEAEDVGEGESEDEVANESEAE